MTEKKERQSADIEEKRIALNGTEAEGEKQHSKAAGEPDTKAKPSQTNGEAASEPDRGRRRANHRDGEAEPDHAFRF